jgi:hypothetical protein
LVAVPLLLVAAAMPLLSVFLLLGRLPGIAKMFLHAAMVLCCLAFGGGSYEPSAGVLPFEGCSGCSGCDASCAREAGSGVGVGE